MKPANATFGGAPAQPPTHPRRTGEGRALSPNSRAPLESSEIARDRWASCEEAAPVNTLKLQTGLSRFEEPSTGVMQRPAEATPPRESGVMERRVARRAANGTPPIRRLSDHRSNAPGWRCLDWDRAPKERRVTSQTKVTIVQLSKGGDLIRQNGPDAWLPEAGDFVHRMARLIAQGLGFERCRSLCLRGQNTVLTVAEAGDRRLVAVTGPQRSMTNVLRRAGLE